MKRLIYILSITLLLLGCKSKKELTAREVISEDMAFSASDSTSIKVEEKEVSVLIVNSEEEEIEETVRVEYSKPDSALNQYVVAVTTTSKKKVSKNASNEVKTKDTDTSIESSSDKVLDVERKSDVVIEEKKEVSHDSDWVVYVALAIALVSGIIFAYISKKWMR
jgi:hypothetical protein